MRIIGRSSEHEMVYEFLKMEITSDRYRHRIESILQEMQVDRDVVTNGDINSEDENALRTEILGRFRGYKKHPDDVFGCFPTNIEWVWTEFDRADILKIIYMNYSYWNELSYYTGSPLDAARYILSGKTLYDMPTDGAIADALWLIKGNKFPPLILLTDKDEKRYMVLEGHGRMTAYGLVPALFHNVSVLLGYCATEELDKWYGEMPERPE